MCVARSSLSSDSWLKEKAKKLVYQASDLLVRRRLRISPKAKSSAKMTNRRVRLDMGFVLRDSLSLHDNVPLTPGCFLYKTAVSVEKWAEAVSSSDEDASDHAACHA